LPVSFYVVLTRWIWAKKEEEEEAFNDDDDDNNDVL
jgi:hypothetical protein